jgi:hypothetical protein
MPKAARIVDIDVCGEAAFGVDHRGWQADAFSRFTLSASLTNNPPSIH